MPLLNNISLSYSGNLSSFFDYDSSVISDADFFSPRLLGCSTDLFLPVGSTSRLLITSTDVIHSFSLPSIGLKVDALPGRINQLFSTPSRVGVFFGQCSEICGSNHSFIPISVRVTSSFDYDNLGKLLLVDLLGCKDVF